MSIRVEWVRYGRPAAEALRAALAAAKGGDPLAPACVVVPSNHVGVSARRLLASGEAGPLATTGVGLAAVTFLTLYRLAELLGAARLAAQGCRPVSTPVVAAALRRALADEPGVFAPVATHPSTEMALVNAYRELRDLSDAGLDALSATSQRAADVVRLKRTARARLETGFSDEEDLVLAAIEAVRSDPSKAAAFGPLVVHLPERLTRHGATLLRVLSEHAVLHVLAGTTGDRRADTEVRQSLRRLAGAIDPPPASDHPAGDVVSSSATRIVTTSDADEEVRVAVRWVMDAARRSVPLEKIAVLYATHEPYARLVHEQLEAAGIGHNGAAAVPLVARVAGRTLLGLLALPAADFHREDVFAWLAGARLHDRGRRIPVTAWERLSRDAGVVAGRQQWDVRLAVYASDCDTEAERWEEDPEAPEWRAVRLREDAERARQLRAFALRLIDDLAAAVAAWRTWPEHAVWARRHLAYLLGGERHRTRWPATEQKAAERTERAVDRLERLGAVEGPVDLEVFRRTLELELDADLGRVGRMGEGVLVGSVRMGAGLDLELAVVLGLAEGSFPAPVTDDSLLPDHERAAAGGELALRAEATERQHRDLLAVVAGARRQVLCVPRGDLRRSSRRVPSRWVADVAGSLAGTTVHGAELPSGDHQWLEHVPSFDAGLRVATPATEQEYRLRALLAAGAGPGHAGASQAGASRAGPNLAGAAGFDDPVLGRAVAMVAGRRSRRFTRFDGNLAGLAVPSPVDGATSATRLEGWAACPFAYFVRNVLGVEPVENPEERLTISPLDLGTLVHEVLEKFLDDVLARPATEQPDPEHPWSAADRRQLRDIAHRFFDSMETHGLVGRPIFWQRDRRLILADLEFFLADDSAHRARHGTRPVAAELAFGMPGSALGAVALALPDGRAVRFRGKADRLDVAADGSLEVIDYKTGSRRDYRGLDEDEPDAHGRRLQLPVYALAARAHAGRDDAPVRAQYWFVSRRQGFDRIGYTVTDDVLVHVGTTVSRIVKGIEAGVFAAMPQATSTTPMVICQYCDPDGLGVSDLQRQLARKRDDPALAVYFELVEGAAAEEAEPDGPEANGDRGA